MALYQISWAIDAAAKQLANAYQSREEATRIARELVGLVTGHTPTQLILRAEECIEETTWHAIQQLLDEHLHNHKPLAYILGSQPFLTLDLTIVPPILIPRPETEWWVAHLIEECQKLDTATKNSLRILDLCTGSGCIALALAHALPQSHIIGIDINPAAIPLAQQNSARNNVDNVTFVLSDLFKELGTQTFDLIVANPPYISQSDYQTLEESVRNWEDPQALWAENEGTQLIRQIVMRAPEYLTDALSGHLPRLWIEIGYDQAVLAPELSTDLLSLTSMRDQFGIPRLLVEAKKTVF